MKKIFMIKHTGITILCRKYCTKNNGQLNNNDKKVLFDGIKIIINSMKNLYSDTYGNWIRKT